MNATYVSKSAQFCLFLFKEYRITKLYFIDMINHIFIDNLNLEKYQCIQL